jgi:preprotein translocase subunit SecY
MQFWETTKPGPGLSPELGLRRRILYTILLVLVFRLLATVPLFNVDEEKLHELLAHNPLVASLDLLAGGDVLTSFSLVAAGIFPYLLALGLTKAATRLIPPLRELEERGESGKKRLELISQLITVPLAFAFAWGVTHYFAQETGFFPGKIRWFTGSSFFSTFGIVGAMTVGTLVTLGITTLITKKGVGSGESVLLIVGSCLGFCGQIAKILFEASDLSSAGRQLELQGAVVILVLLVCYGLIKAERRIPILSAKNPKYAGSYLPLLPNHGGVLPITSAVGLFTLLKFGEIFLAAHFPEKFVGVQHGLAVLTDPARGIYWAGLAVFVVLLTYANNFSVLWKPYSDSETTLTEDFRKKGWFIPNLRPGPPTEQYLSRMTMRLSLLGALILAFIAAGLPYLIVKFTGQNVFVTVLAVFVFIQTLQKLRPEIAVHAIEGKYDDLLKSGRK